MKTHATATVEKAIVRIRRVHAIGVASLQQNSGRIGHGKWHKLAKEAGLPPDL